MLLDATPKLEDLIVELLTAKALPASQIQQILIADAKEFSIQAIYKALRILEASGVVVKERKKYSLRLSWVDELSHFAKSASNNYLADAKARLPKPGKRIIWHFHDLLELNNFWSQILLLMIGQVHDRTLLTWMPHPWFHLAYSEQEGQYIKSLELTGTKLYLINGGTTFLDRWAEKYWQNPNIEYSDARSPFHEHDKSHYINVLDDYVLTVKLDRNIANEIEIFYDTIKSFDDLGFSEVFRIFGLKVQASMWLENNSKKAEILRKRFKNYFGIL